MPKDSTIVTVLGMSILCLIWSAGVSSVRLNITYLNDYHECPASKAAWQDYTVYLEIKPRLCMIQITWNARYKREPVYQGGWWGGATEYTYRTVYDPDVRFIDLHWSK